MSGISVLTTHGGEPLLEALEPADLYALVLDARGRVVFANARGRTLLATQVDGEVLRHLREQLAEVNAGASSATRELLVGPVVGGLLIRWSSSRYVALTGRSAGLLGIGIDVSGARKREQELLSLALHDPLTGLPNRALLDDRLGQAIRAAGREELTCALLVLDLDRFKALNDRSGHAAGDELLRQIGSRLRAELRGSDTVARVGGDEFAILLPPPSDLGAALAIAGKIRNALAAPFLIDGEQQEVGASIGVGLFPQHARDADGLTRAADLAMYAAKRSGRSIAVYDREDDRRSRVERERIGRLKHAIDANDLRLEFQAARDLRSGETARAEALLRWDDPRNGAIPPASFLPIAEHSSLRRPLLTWVLDHALGACAGWRADGARAGVSVNLSLRDLLDPDLASITEEALRTVGLAAESLTLEVNERHLGNDPRRVSQTLNDLDRLGVRLALDDFGRGDLSLRSVSRLPLDEVKLDSRAIGSLFSDPRSWAFVRGRIDLGHDLGMQVVAKGVEDGVTSDLLARLGCDAGQGFFFARPLAEEDVRASLGRAALS